MEDEHEEGKSGRSAWRKGEKGQNGNQRAGHLLATRTSLVRPYLPNNSSSCLSEVCVKCNMIVLVSTWSRVGST